jgi:hypothetical protein
MIEMIDRLLEVLVRCLLYLIRIVIRMKKERGSSSRPVEKGTVTGSSCEAAPYGGPVAEITYTYTHKGEYFSGMNREPFILSSSAEEYVARFRAGGDVIVRVKPGEPEASIVREDDQALGILK